MFGCATDGCSASLGEMFGALIARGRDFFSTCVGTTAAVGSSLREVFGALTARGRAICLLLQYSSGCSTG